MTTSSVSPVTTELAGSETGITLIIHAGAGNGHSIARQFIVWKTCKLNVSLSK